MRQPEMLALLDYWRSAPPENELLSILAQAHTSWRPPATKPQSAEEARARHRASLEARWAAGAEGPDQILRMLKARGGTLNIGTDGGH